MQEIIWINSNKQKGRRGEQGTCSSGVTGNAASLLRYPAPPPRTSRMESLWPGSPPIALSISKDGEQQGSHHPTRTNLLLATAALIMNAARIFKPLTTAIDKGPTNINSTMTGLGKFCSLSSHMAGWQGILHLLKWLVLFLFRIAGQADSVPQRAKSVLSSCISEERSPVGRQMRANSSLE